MNKRLKLILILLILLFLVFIGFLLYRNTKFRVVSISPSFQNLNNVTPYVDITFSENLKNNINIEMTNQGLQSYKVKNNQLFIYFNIPLSTRINYQIKISNIKSESNKTIKNVEYKFKPIFSLNISTNSYKYLQQQQIQYNQQQSLNQLMQMLPFSSPNGLFEINYKNTNGFVLIITANGTQNQKLALNWLNADGYNPKDYKIQYINAQP